MEEQFPTPLIEIILLHLYLSSMTLLLGVIALFLIIKSKNNFTWVKYILHSILLFLVVTIISLLIWEKWPFGFDIMFGPLNLPTLMSLLVVLGIYASIKKNRKSI